MDTKKIIDDLLLVVQNLNVGNSTIFHNRENKKCIEYEIHSTENIPVITMRYSMDPSENNVETRRKNEELIDKNKDIVETVFNENINEGSSTSVIKQKLQNTFPIQHNEEDSGYENFLKDKTRNNTMKIKTRSAGKRKIVSNAAEEIEETSKFQIETIISRDSSKHDMITEVICETAINNEGNHRLIEKHTIDKNQFKCSFCEKVFKKTYYKTIHERYHTGERPYTCAECNKSFYTSTHLYRHRKIHTNGRSFTYNPCGKSFRQWSHLKEHTTSTHSNDRPFPCELCGKSFKMKDHLKRHIRIHTGEKPFNCEYCNKSFRHKNTLTEHIRLHTGEKPYICDYCGKRFVSASARSYHEKTSHQKKI